MTKGVQGDKNHIASCSGRPAHTSRVKWTILLMR